MGNVIPLHGDPHEATQKLLPWYLTGTLDPIEQRLIEEHLGNCTECREALASEQRLRAEIAAMPLELPGEWAALRDRAMASARAEPTARRWPSSTTRGGIAALAASQIAIIALGIGGYEMIMRPDRATYHALSTPKPGDAQGNIIVIFRPDSREQVFRVTLTAVGARLVDGPTAAGAYVLSVAPDRRDQVLSDLRARADIVLAQPLDPAAVR
jgi:hypothetical protein